MVGYPVCKLDILADGVVKRVDHGTRRGGEIWCGSGGDGKGMERKGVSPEDWRFGVAMALMIIALIVVEGTRVDEIVVVTVDGKEPATQPCELALVAIVFEL